MCSRSYKARSNMSIGYLTSSFPRPPWSPFQIGFVKFKNPFPAHGLQKFIGAQSFLKVLQPKRLRPHGFLKVLLSDLWRDLSAALHSAAKKVGGGL